LGTIVGNQQQIDAGVERLNDGRADDVLIDRAHHQIVGDDDALVVPSLADDPVSAFCDAGRSRSNERLQQQRGKPRAQDLQKIPEFLQISPPAIARDLSIVSPAHQQTAAQCPFPLD